MRKNNNTIKIKNRLVSIFLVSSMILGLMPNFTQSAYAQMSFNQMTDVNIISVAVGAYHQLALDDQGNVWAWGENVNGKQGLGADYTTHSDPRKVTRTNLGSQLPPIKQMSASYQNSLLLDVDGKVWSAGIGEDYANGNNSIAVVPYFTNVSLGGKKAVYVSGGEYSGMAVDEDGHLWFWGHSRFNSNGLNNNNTAIRTPQMLTTGTTNIGTTADSANNINITNIKFVAVETSDWQDTHGGAAIALTDEGDIWTWGVGRQTDAIMLASGGSYRPKKVTATDASSSIKTLPRSIAKIDAGVGSFSFLDTDGSLWTWGANGALEGQGGMLGHGMTGLNTLANRVKAPKKVDTIKTSNSATPTAAPRFVDYGLYGWNLYAIDGNGNIYATGELNYNTDIGVGNLKNILTKGNLPANVRAGKMVKTSGGYFGAVLFIDINGNVWEGGTYANGPALTAAGFPQTRGLFTSLSADDVTTTPAVDEYNNPLQDVYGNYLYEKKLIYKSQYLDGTPVENLHQSNSTLTATVAAGTGYTVKEVQYIKLYDDDPYYNQLSTLIKNGTGSQAAPGFRLDKLVINNTKVLASESFPYFKHYVTELFSETDFNQAFGSTNSTTTRESGLMNPTGTTGAYTVRVDDNCIVVLQSVTYKNGSPSALFTNRMSYEFNSFYTPVRLYDKGVKLTYGGIPFDKNDVQFHEDKSFNYGLYAESSFSGANTRLYGLYYTHDGRTYNPKFDPLDPRFDTRLSNNDPKVLNNPVKPTAGFDKIIVEPKAVPFWELSPERETQVREIILDSEAYQESATRLDGINTSALDEHHYAPDGSYYTDASTGLVYYKNPVDNKYYVLITYTFQKDASWVPVKVHYVDDSLTHIQVYEDDQSSLKTQNPELIGSFSPNAVPFSQGNSPFIPPRPEDESAEPIGYIKTAAGDSPNIANLVPCSFPDGFNPTLSSNDDIYIVYKSGVFKVTENLVLDTINGSPVAKSSVLQIEGGKNYGQYEQGEDNTNSHVAAPKVNGYVAIESWIQKLDPAENLPDGPAIRLGGGNGLYGNQVTAFIENIHEPWDVYFVYKRDVNDNGIPDEYEGGLNVRWVGMYEDASQEILASRIYEGDGKKDPVDVIVFNDHEGESHGVKQEMGSKSWIFNPAATTKNWMDSLNNSFPDFPITYEYQMGVKDKILIFYYDIDMNGNGVADKDEGNIQVLYRDTDNNPILDTGGNPLINDSNEKKIEGDAFEKAAPELEGYVAVQTKIDTYTNATDLDTSSARQNINTALLPAPPGVGKFGHVVTFFYMPDRNNNGIPDEYEGKVTIQWVAVTASGSEIVMYEDTRWGVGKTSEGTPLGSLYTSADTGTVNAEAYTPTSQWLFDTGEYDTPNRNVVAEYGYTGKWYFDYQFDHGHDQLLKFYYDEDYNRNSIPDRLEPMKITVIGQAGDAELYSYVINKGLADRPFTIEPFPEATYKFKSSQALQFKNSTGEIVSVNNLKQAELDGLIKLEVIAQGPAQPITIVPMLGHQTVIFEYDSNMTEVTIEAYYGESGNLTTTPVEGFTSFKIPAEIGKAFTYQAPSIGNHSNLLPADGIGKLDTVSENENNVIPFYYIKNQGSLTVIAKEYNIETNQYTDVVIGNTGRQIAAGDPIGILDTNAAAAAEIPALANYDLVLGTGVISPPGTTVYNGIGDVTLTYGYVKKMRNIKVEAYNFQTKLSIGEMPLQKYTVGQVQTIHAPTGADIAALGNYTLVGDDMQAVYVGNTGTDDITVRFNYLQNTGGDVKVAAYWNDGTRDIEIKSYTNQYPVGETVLLEAPALVGWKLASAPPDNASTVSIISTEAPQEVKFKYEKDLWIVNVTLKDNKTPQNNISSLASFKDRYEVIKGSDLTIYAPYVPGYVLANDTDAVKLLTELSKDEDVTFIYRPISEIIRTQSVNITIEGVDQDSGLTLYSYVIAKPKNSGTITVNAFTLTEYELKDNAAAIVDVIETDETVTFHYKSLITSVTIQALLEDTAAPVPGFIPINARAQIGQPFSYRAPYIYGYNLIGDSIQSILAVDELNNQLTFVYTKTSGNVLVVLKENDTNGRLIKTESEILPFGEESTIQIPDLSNENYTLAANQSPKTVTYEGTAIVVEYYYIKDTRGVEIVTYDVTNSEDPVKIASYPMQERYPIGEVSTFSAPDESGYKLIGQGTIPVLIEKGNGTQEVVFNYVTLEEDEAIVTAVQKDTNYILASTVVKAQRGSDLTIYAPIILGNELVEDELPSKKITIPGAASFKYNKTNDMTVNIHVTYMNITDNMVLFSKDIVRDINSGAVEIKADAVEGFILLTDDTLTVPTDGSITEVVFEYQRIKETAITLKSYDEDRNLLGSYTITGLKSDKIYRINTADFSYAGYIFDFSEPAAADGLISFITHEDAANNIIVLNYKKEKADVVVNYINVNNPSTPFNTIQTNEAVGSEFFANTDMGNETIFLYGNDRIMVDKDVGKNIINLYYVSVAELLNKTVLVKHIAQTPELPARTWLMDTEVFTDLTAPNFTYDDGNSQKIMEIMNNGFSYMPHMTIPGSLEVDLVNAPDIYTIQLFYEPLLQHYEIQYMKSSDNSLLETVGEEGYMGTLIPNPELKTFTGLKFAGIEKDSPILTRDTAIIKVLYDELARPKITVRLLDEATKEVIDTMEFVRYVGEVFYYRPHVSIARNGVIYNITPASNVEISEIANNDENLNTWDFLYTKEVKSAHADIVIQYVETNGTVVSEFIERGKLAGGSYTYTAPTFFIKEGYQYTINASADRTRTVVLVSGINEMRFQYNKTLLNTGSTGGGSSNGGGSVSNGGSSNAVGNGNNPVSPSPKPPEQVEIVNSHIQYIHGYADKTVKPDAFLTRAEAVQILFTLIDDPNKYNPIASKFTDVKEDSWYSHAVNYMAKKGVAVGYKDGSFRPGANITRAEYATLMIRFNNLSLPESHIYSDIPGHWAVQYITLASQKGWVKGYPDGTFRPQANITRAEAVTMTNKVLGRNLDSRTFKESGIANLHIDIDESHWAFYAIMEASMEHEHVTEAGREVWVKNNPSE